jgi:biotin synthase
MVRWRRIQLVKHLIERKDLPPEAIEFDEAGSIASVHASPALVEACVSDGSPFTTDGCPDRSGALACNRPYGSYRPGEAFRDYPFRPGPEDVAIIRCEGRFEEITDGRGH